MRTTQWALAAEVFSEVVDLSGAERERQLKALCSENTELRVAVQALLNQASEVDAHWGMEDDVQQAFSEWKPSTDIAPGSRLGEYRVVRSLGQGGMGQVYLAERDIDGGTQRVALKIPQQRSGMQFIERFRRERRILASLGHPAIARLVDSGFLAEDRPYFAMEYVDGLPITDYCDQHRLNLAQRLQLFLQVLPALQHAHESLVLHRDIKAANVLIGQDGLPRLLDFGIAKTLDDIASADVTMDGAHFFSLGSAAPEQVSGATTGVATDIYALGALLYQLVCGLPALDLSGLAPRQALLAISEQVPLPPSSALMALAERDSARAKTVAEQRSTQSPAILARQLRGDLDLILARTLRKEPRARYASVDAFARDLQALIDMRPIAQRHGDRLYRLTRFVRRHRLAVTMISVLLMTLCGGGMALWLQYGVIRNERDTALVERRRAEALNGLLLNAFEAADPSRNRGSEVTAREVLDQAARRLDDDAVDPTTRSSLLLSIADVYRTLGLASDAKKAIEVAVGQGEKGTALDQARALRSLAFIELDLGDIAAAEIALKSAADLIPEGDGREVLIESIEQERAAIQILIARGLAPEALPRYETLYERAKALLGNGDTLTTQVGVALSERLRVMRQPAKSLALVEELLRSISDPNHMPLGVRLLGDKVRCQRSLHQFDLASRSAVEYLGAVRALYGDRHPSYISALGLLARTEQDVGKTDDAVAHIREAIRLQNEISASSDSPLHATLSNNLALVLIAAGRNAEAVMAAQTAVDIAVRLLPADHNNIAVFRSTLGQALVANQDFIAALAQLDESEVIFAARHTATSPGVFRAEVQIYRAQALLALGKKTEAEVAFTKGWLTLRDLDQADEIRRHALIVRQRLDQRP